MKHPTHHNQRKKNQSKTRKNQVRIVGGQFKRRKLEFIDVEGLRPTPDRMRETLFSWLMHDIHEAVVLDAFAGSGVLGFEALSRGAEQTVFIEYNRQQYLQLKESAQTLHLKSEQAIIYHGESQQLLATIDNNCVFDVVFLDPPYSKNLWLPIIKSLLIQRLINSDSLLYVEADKPIEQIFPEYIIKTENSNYMMKILKEKNMGQVYSYLGRIENIDR